MARASLAPLALLRHLRVLLHVLGRELLADDDIDGVARPEHSREPARRAHGDRERAEARTDPERLPRPALLEAEALEDLVALHLDEELLPLERVPLVLLVVAVAEAI